MPTIKTSFRWCIIHMIGIIDRVVFFGIIGISHKRRAIRLFPGHAIFRPCKTSGAAKIILCSRTTDGRIFFITIQYRIILLQLRQTLPSPLCMEISHILRKLIIKSIINLIEKCRYFFRFSFFTITDFTKILYPDNIKTRSFCSWLSSHIPSKPHTEIIFSIRIFPTQNLLVKPSTY